MLHVGILPNHAAWADMLANLAVVVIDEAHVYRGVFGSHVANVLRRLRRAASFYGTAPRFVLASATIANPVELAERLTGLEPFALVDRDGAPASERRVAVWNPPLEDEALGTRGSALAEAAEIVAGLAKGGARTICFIKSRKAVELIARFVVDRDRDLEGLVAPYRAGYTPQQRRELERKLVAGELQAVIATDALELGIDIGALDAAVVVTFPGTVASLKQMWGRAGRRGRGLAVYVAGEDALDQFLCRHPRGAARPPRRGGDPRPASPRRSSAQHLACAAHEAPLTHEDDAILGPGWREHADALVAEGVLRERRGAYGLREPSDYPAARVSLRSASPDAVDARRHRERARWSGRSSSRARSPPCTTARSTCTWAAQFEVAALDLDRAPRAARALRRRTGTRRPSARPRRASSGCSTAARRSASACPTARSLVTDEVHRLPAQVDHRPPGDRLPGARPPGHRVPRPGRCGSSSTTCWPRHASRASSCSARCTRWSTGRSPCSRCSPCATAGTSAGSRRTPTRRR